MDGGNLSCVFFFPERKFSFQMQSLWGKKRRRRELREDKRRAFNDRKRKICELKLMQLPNSNRCHHGDKASDFINFFPLPVCGELWYPVKYIQSLLKTHWKHLIQLKISL